jgi:hypothetical protein
MRDRIMRLQVFDFDGTLMQTISPETGKGDWKRIKNKKYEPKGWWASPISLDLDVFNIKPFKSVLAQLKKEKATPKTYVIILTSRLESLRPEVQEVLDKNNIQVDKLDMKYSEETKGEKILEYINQFPYLREISVYDDRAVDIDSYKSIINKIPRRIIFNIYLANHGNLSLTESKLIKIINEEIKKIKLRYL